MMTLEEQIDLMTGLTKAERKKVLSWIASLSSEEMIVDIFQDSVKRSFQLKEQNPLFTGKIIKYSAFLLSARKSGWDTVKGKGYQIAEKKQYDDFSNLRKAKAAALIQKGRTPVLRKKILAHWAEVKELKAEGNGFRPIVDYLSRTRRIKTSVTYLARLWKDIEKC